MRTMRKNSKVFLLALVMFVSLLFAVLGLDSFRAFAQTGTEPTAASFVMTEGASVRIGKADGKNGIRYQATMSVDDYDALKGNESYDVTFGVLVTFDAYAQVKPLNQANVFDEATAVYATADEQGNVPAGKAPIAIMEAEKMSKDEGKNVMYLGGSIVDIKNANLERAYVGTAYVKFVEKATSEASYLFATASDNARSIAQVARAAVDNTTVEPVLGADEKAWLQENYLDVASHTVTFDGNGAEVAPETVSYGGKATLVMPSRADGYAFVEWQLDGVAYDFNTPVTEDITLTAVWRFVEYSKLSIPDLNKVTPAIQETNEADFVHSDDGYGSKVVLTPTEAGGYAQVYYKPATAGSAVRAFVKVVGESTPKFLTNTNLVQYYVTMPMNEWTEIYIPYTNDFGCLLMITEINETVTIYIDGAVEVTAAEYEAADTDKLSNVNVVTDATLSYALQPHAYEMVNGETSKHSLRFDLGATGSCLQLYAKAADKKLSSGMIYVVNNTPNSTATIEVTENPTVPLNTWTRLNTALGITEGLFQLKWTAGSDFTVYFDNLEFADPCLKLTSDDITALDSHYDGTAGSYHWTTASTDAGMHIHMAGKGEGSWSGVYVNKAVDTSVYKYMTFELKMNVYVANAANGTIYLAGKQDSTTFSGASSFVSKGKAIAVHTYDVSTASAQQVELVRIDLAAVAAAGIELSEGFTIYYGSNAINQAVIYKIRLG